MSHVSIISFGCREICEGKRNEISYIRDHCVIEFNVETVLITKAVPSVKGNFSSPSEK